jgi:dihydroorotase
MTDRHDLLLTGGSLLGADGELTEQNVAIRAGKIAYVGSSRDVSAVRSVDISGQLLLPGLVDLHTHIFRGCTFWGVDHRRAAWRSGVTTWIDAGSAGAYSAAGFRELVGSDRSSGSVYGWLNISAIGLVGESFESQQIENCDEAAAREVLAANRDLFVGFKVRIDHNAVGGHGLEPLRRAQSIASELDVPIMVHIGVGPPAIEDVLDLMRPGDLLTHCYTAVDMSLVDSSGRVRDAVLAARERGMLLDLGHGAGGFAFRTAETMLAAGLPPDTISSDLHQLSAHGPMVDLVTCMNKLLALGLPLGEVVAAATSSPARVAGLSESAGSIRVGADADLAVASLEDGEFEYSDVLLDKRVGTQRLRVTDTLVRGRSLEPALPELPAPWIAAIKEDTDAHARLREAVRVDPVFDPGASWRFGVPDLLDWNGHG